MLERILVWLGVAINIEPSPAFGLCSVQVFQWQFNLIGVQFYSSFIGEFCIQSQSMSIKYEE